MVKREAGEQRRAASDIVLGSVCLGMILGWVSFAWNGSGYAFGAAIAQGVSGRLLIQVGIIAAFVTSAAVVGRFSSGCARGIRVASPIIAIAAVFAAWLIPGLSRDVLHALVGLAQGALMSAWLMRFRGDLPSMVLMMCCASALQCCISLSCMLYDAWAARALSLVLPVGIVFLLGTRPDPGAEKAGTPCESMEKIAAIKALFVPAAGLLTCKLAFGFISYGQTTLDMPATYFVAVVSALFALAIYCCGLPSRETLFISLVAVVCACVGLLCAFPHGPTALYLATYSVSWLFNLYLLAWFGQRRTNVGTVSPRAGLLGWATAYCVTACSNAIAVVIDGQVRVVLALTCTVASLVIVLLQAWAAASESRRAVVVPGDGSSAAPAEGSSLEARVHYIADAHGLTSSEQNVLLLLAYGFSLKQIADKLCVSENTAKYHRHNVYKKLAINSRDELIALVRANLHGAGEGTTSA